MDYDAMMAMTSAADFMDERGDDVAAMSGVGSGRRESFLKLLEELGLDEKAVLAAEKKPSYSSRSSLYAKRPPSTMVNLLRSDMPVTAADLLLTGFSARELYNAGYSATDLKGTAEKMSSEAAQTDSPGLRSSLKELQTLQLLRAGYAEGELAAAGFSIEAEAAAETAAETETETETETEAEAEAETITHTTPFS
jgi:hypothetical protein